jgi:hypothetical protein
MEALCVVPSESWCHNAAFADVVALVVVVFCLFQQNY